MEDQNIYNSHLLLNVSDAVFSTDEHFIIKSWNPAAEQMYGFTAQEVIGQPVSILRIRIPADGLKEDLYNLQRKGYHKNEYDAFKKDGTLITILASVNVIYTGDKITGYVAVHHNISDRKQLENRMKEFNQELAEKVLEKTAEMKKAFQEKENALNSITDGVIVVDADWKYIFLNDAALKEHPGGKEYLLGKSIWEIHPGLEGTVFGERYKEAMRSRKPAEIEGYYAPYGTWFNAKIYPADEGLTIYYKDISDRKNAEEEIRRSNERFELIGMAANDAVWEWNLETNKIWSNETHQHLYGLTLADPVPDETEWRQRLHEEDRERILRSIDEALASDVNVWAAEYRLLTVHKGWIHVYGRTYIERNAEGKPIRMLGSMMDITDRIRAEQKIRESEARYRSLIEQASDPIIIYSMDGKIRDYNHAFTEFIGYTKEDMETLLITHLLFEKDLAERPLQFGKIVKGNSVHDVRRVRKKDGTAIDIELNSKMMPDGNIMAIARDITERKKAEQEILQMNKQLRLLSEHLQNIREEERLKIAREIHDELGQQLTVMKMDVSWLQKRLGSTDDQYQQRTESLKNMLDTTVRTVRRISSELRPSILDDMGLIVAIEWHLGEFKKRVDIETHFVTNTENPSLPANTKIGLFRIVQESLTNVARHAHARNVIVNVAEKGNHLVLTVADDGIGFHQQEIMVKKTLGLMGMKERTLMMGGAFEISSSPGKGATIIITVPLLQEPVV